MPSLSAAEPGRGGISSGSRLRLLQHAPGPMSRMVIPRRITLTSETMMAADIRSPVMGLHGDGRGCRARDVEPPIDDVGRHADVGKFVVKSGLIFWLRSQLPLSTIFGGRHLIGAPEHVAEVRRVREAPCQGKLRDGTVGQRRVIQRSATPLQPR